MRSRSAILVALDARDRELLDALAARAEVSRTQILRWSLRAYALHGPWTRAVEERQELVGSDPLDVGPRLEVIP
jgi:hypothetical protein